MELDRTTQHQPLSSRSPEDLLEGTPYQTLGFLGKGGMGEVLEARHVALDKTVVVKILGPAFGETSGFAARLRLEAQLVARLSHPNIVMMLDFGKTKTGRPYLVMERLFGHTLREELAKRGPLPWREAILHVLELLSALNAAHQAGIIHRDIKPDNVFLVHHAGGQKTIKLLDFGIAKIAADAPVSMPTAIPTNQGVLLGTPRFVAPEQARAGVIDARTDLYSVGVLLHWLITLRGPFPNADGLGAMLRAHVFDPPLPPSKAGPRDLPAALDVIVLKALEKNPRNRFQTAASFAEALRACLEMDQKPPRWLVTERLFIAPRPPLPPASPEATTQKITLPNPRQGPAQKEQRAWVTSMLAATFLTIAIAVGCGIAYLLTG